MGTARPLSSLVLPHQWPRPPSQVKQTLLSFRAYVPISCAFFRGKWLQDPFPRSHHIARFSAQSADPSQDPVREQRSTGPAGLTSFPASLRPTAQSEVCGWVPTGAQLSAILCRPGLHSDPSDNGDNGDRWLWKCCLALSLCKY